MKEEKRIGSDKFHAELTRIITIGNKAVKAAKEENKRFGIPDTFWKNGKIFYILPDGEITTSVPEILA